MIRRVVLVAMNTEPLYNRQVHIGRVAMYALGPKGEVTATNACEFDDAVSKISLRLVRHLSGEPSSNRSLWSRVLVAFSTSAFRRKVKQTRVLFYVFGWNFY